MRRGDAPVDGCGARSMTILERFRLDGKVALVTGGARGFGRVMVEALAGAGAAVGLSARNLEQAEGVAKDVSKASGGQVLGVRADVTSASDVRAMVDAVLARFGRLD